MATFSILVEVGSRGVSVTARGIGDIGDAAGKAERKVAGLKTVVAAAGAVFAAVGGARLAQSFLDAATEGEGFRVRLKVLLGDVEEAGRLFEDMSAFASRVPFEYRDIMESATRLSGVLRGGREEISAWMPLIGDLAAATGLKITDTTDQVIRMLSAGAGAADLFRERGVLAMLGFQAGVATTAEETRRRLVEAWTDVNSQFRGATEDMAQTWTGMSSMLSDAWFRFRSTVMDQGLFDAMKEIQGDLVAVAQSDQLVKFARDVGGALTAVVRGVRSGIEVWSALKAAVFETMASIVGAVTQVARVVSAVPQMIMGGFETLASLGGRALELLGFDAGIFERIEAGARRIQQTRDEILELGELTEESLRERAARAVDEMAESLRDLGTAATSAAGPVGDLLGETEVDAEAAAKRMKALVDRINEIHERAQKLRQLEHEAMEAVFEHELERSPIKPIEVEGRVDLEPIEGSLERLAENIRRRLGDAMQAVAATWRDAVAAGLDVILNGTGDLSERIQAGFGAAGAHAGATFGAQFGPMGEILGQQLGQKVGEFVGKIVGGLLSTGADEAFARITVEGREAVSRVRFAEGQTREAIEGAAGAIADAINGIVEMLGGRLEGLGDLAIKIRDGEEVRVWVDGVRHVFEEVEDAVRFAIVEGLKRADIAGLAPQVREALEGTMARTVEQLERDLQVGLDLRDIQLSDIERQAMELVRERVRLFDEGLALGISSAGDALSRGVVDVAALRDAALGIQRGEEELSRERVAAFNAAHDAFEAELVARRSEIELLIAQGEAQQRYAEVVGESMAAVMELAGEGGDALMRFREVMGSTRGMSQESLEGLRRALAEIDEALADLAPRITEAERRRQAGRERRRERREERESIEEELGRGRGLAGDLAGRQGEFEALKERIEAAGFSGARSVELIGEALLRLEEDLAEVREGVFERAAGFLGGEVAEGMAGIRRTAAELTADLTALEEAGLAASGEVARLVGEIGAFAQERIDRTVLEGIDRAVLSVLELLGRDGQAAEVRFRITLAELEVKRQELALAMAQGELSEEAARRAREGMETLAGLIGELERAGPSIFGGGAVGGPRTSGSSNAGPTGGFGGGFSGGGFGGGGFGGAGSGASSARERALGLLQDVLDRGFSPFGLALRDLQARFRDIRRELGETVRIGGEAVEVQALYREALEDLVSDALEPIRSLREGLALGGSSPLRPVAKLSEAREQFFGLAEEILASGDLSRIPEVAGLAQDLLGIAGDVLPRGGGGYRAIFEAVNSALLALEGLDPEAVAEAMATPEELLRDTIERTSLETLGALRQAVSALEDQGATLEAVRLGSDLGSARLGELAASAASLAAGQGVVIGRIDRAVDRAAEIAAGQDLLASRIDRAADRQVLEAQRGEATRRRQLATLGAIEASTASTLDVLKAGAVDPVRAA